MILVADCLCFASLSSCPTFEVTSCHTAVNRPLGLRQYDAHLHVHKLRISSWNDIRRYAALLHIELPDVQFMQVNHIHGTTPFNCATSLFTSPISPSARLRRTSLSRLGRSIRPLESPISTSFCRNVCTPDSLVLPRSYIAQSLTTQARDHRMRIWQGFRNGPRRLPSLGLRLHGH